MMEDEVQERITHYENKFNELINEIENDSILKTWARKIEANHTTGILVQMKKQINEYLDKYLGYSI